MKVFLKSINRTNHKRGKTLKLQIQVAEKLYHFYIRPLVVIKTQQL